jgi:predicted RNase H-like nuclease (RuvC/YqgF family)
VGSEMKQRCAHLEHKVQDLERRNARLERQLGDTRTECEKSQRQLEAYKAHYVSFVLLFLPARRTHSRCGALPVTARGDPL